MLLEYSIHALCLIGHHFALFDRFHNVFQRYLFTKDIGGTVMVYIGHQNETHYWYRKASIPLLAFFWCVGLLFGALSAICAGEQTISLMRTLPQGGVSIVSLLVSQSLPFLISAYAVYIHLPWLLFPIAFGKAFTFSLCASLITVTYSSAGWLLRLLLMFSDLALCPLLILFWVRHIRNDRKLKWQELLAFAVAVVVCVYVDQTFVSPFLEAVLKY